MDSVRRKAIHAAMLRLSDGDRAAFDVLVDELWPVLLSFANGVGQRADVEDVAQEVFYKICSRIGEFDRERDGASWAFGIASYEILTLRRRQQRRREVQDASVLAAHADLADSQETRLLERELETLAQRAMAMLSAEDQSILSRPTNEPSAAAATLRKRKQRAVARLRLLWRRMYGES